MKKQVEVLDASRNEQEDTITLKVRIKGGIVNIEISEYGGCMCGVIKKAWKQGGKEQYIVKGDVVIPSEVEFEGRIYPINRIGMGAFKGQDKITSVYMPDSIIRSYNYIFAGCSNLTKVRLSENLRYIGGYDFAYTGIKEIEIPASTTLISIGAFRNCKRLSKVILPQILHYIHPKVFTNCSQLKKLVVPKDTFVFKGAFAKERVQVEYMENKIIPPHPQQVMYKIAEKVAEKFVN